MSPEETIDLLSVAAAFDLRTTGESEVTAWHAAVGDLNFDDARAAVVAHYRDTRVWVMPADVRSRVKAMRRERLERQVISAPPAELADEPVRYRAELEANVKRIADGYRPPPAIRGNPARRPPRDYLDARDSLDRHLAERGVVNRDSDESRRALARRQVADSRAAYSGMAPDLGEDLARDNPWRSVKMREPDPGGSLDKTGCTELRSVPCQRQQTRGSASGESWKS